MLPGCSTKALRNGWAAIPLLLVLAGHLAAAAVPPPPGTPQPARFAAGRLIVQLRAQAPGAAVAAAAAAGASSWGQLSAKQHGVALQQAITGAPPPPGSGGTSRRLAAAGTRPGPAVYAITDGSPVLDKVEQLNALPGRGGGEGGGGGHAALPLPQVLQVTRTGSASLASALNRCPLFPTTQQRWPGPPPTTNGTCQRKLLWSCRQHGRAPLQLPLAPPPAAAQHPAGAAWHSRAFQMIQSTQNSGICPPSTPPGRGRRAAAAPG